MSRRFKETSMDATTGNHNSRRCWSQFVAIFVQMGASMVNTTICQACTGGQQLKPIVDERSRYHTTTVSICCMSWEVFVLCSRISRWPRASAEGCKQIQVQTYRRSVTVCSSIFQACRRGGTGFNFAPRRMWSMWK